MPSRLVTSVLLIALGVCGIGWLLCAGDPPEMLVDVTNAASTACVKTQPVCGPNCTRLIAVRNLA